MAAEEMGAVSASPMMTATRMPMGRGASSVERLTTSPSPFMKAETAGPENRPTRPPTMMVTAGTSTMSTGVFPAMREAASAPVNAAR